MSHRVEHLTEMALLFVVLLGFIATQLCAAQDVPLREEAAIRTVVDRYHDAARTADESAARSLVIAGARGSSPGGTADAELIRFRGITPWTNRTTLLRRIVILGPGVAVASGIWRSFNAKPPFDVGTFTYTLLRRDDGWKIAHGQEALLPGPPEHQVSALEPDAVGGTEGWISLFDGKDFNAWVSTNVGTEISDSWRIENGAIVALAKGVRSGLITRRRYRFFQLEFEWMAGAGTNSGVKYRVIAFDRIGNRSAEPLGPEYQLADDDGDPGARNDTRQRSGALYGVTPVLQSVVKPLGTWNQGRIIVKPDSIEHWLNGVRTAQYKPDMPFASAIALQHHTTEVRFRNIRIKPQ